MSTEIKTQNNRIRGYSYLRAVACVAVIALHTVNVAEILYKDTLTATQLSLSLAAVYALMWAVPCFVMVSGALLLDPGREVGLGKIYKKYLFRVVIALILFGLFFRGFDMFMDGEPFAVSSLLKGLINVFTGESWAHLWYLYLLIGIYLLLPFYRMIAAHSSKKLLRYLLLIYVLFLSLLPLTRLFGVESGFYIHVSTIYPFYLFAGFAIADHALKPSRPLAVFILIFATAATIVLTLVRYEYRFENLDLLLQSYASIFVILQGVALFSLFASMPQKGEKPSLFGRMLLFIDENCFGIYLLHMVWIRLVLRYMEVNPYESSLWLFPVLILANLIVTALIIFLLRRIPGLNKIL